MLQKQKAFRAYPKKMYLCRLKLRIMITKKYWKFVVFLFVAALTLTFCSCQSSQNTVHKASKYQKTRTRHTPKWNSTTSQSTTYYIKKHSTRKSHNSKKIKR